MFKKRSTVILGVIFLLLAVFFFSYGLLKDDKSFFGYVFWISATIAFLSASFNNLYRGIKNIGKD